MLEGEKMIYRGNENYKKAYRGEELIWENTSYNYLAFTSLGPATMSLNNTKTQYNYEIEYSRDRKNWSAYTFGDVLSLNKDQYIYFRGNNDLKGGLQFDINDGDIYASGNIMSLIKKGGFELLKTVNEEAFENLFSGCKSLVSAMVLPSVDYVGRFGYSGMFGQCSSLKECSNVECDQVENNGCSYMFSGCSSLSGIYISSRYVNSYACFYMFKDCTSLKKVNGRMGVLSAGNSCFSHMFEGCTGLNNISSLSILSSTMTVPNKACEYMFYNCKNLVIGPKLQATTLGDWSYQGMFSGCSALTECPALPATTLGAYCYANMFSDCISLTECPALPANKLTTGCYESMFSSCRNIYKSATIDADISNATGCCKYMFYECYMLTEMGELRPKVLSESCYEGMFYGCVNLTTATELPATDLKKACYRQMFRECGLTKSPVLPAKTLVMYCYENMFYGCSLLNEVRARMLTTPSPTYTNNWLNGVSSTGTFYKDENATWTGVGPTACPSTWRIERF